PAPEQATVRTSTRSRFRFPNLAFARRIPWKYAPGVLVLGFAAYVWAAGASARRESEAFVAQLEHTDFLTVSPEQIANQAERLGQLRQNVLTWFFLPSNRLKSTVKSKLVECGGRPIQTYRLNYPRIPREGQWDRARLCLELASYIDGND